MKLVLLGATGVLGLATTAAALAAGHEVTAYVRRPDAVAPDDRIRVVGGALDDVVAMAEVFGSADAVLSCVGGRSGDDVMQRVLPPIAAAVSLASTRFVLTSAFGIGDSLPMASFPARLVYRTKAKRLFADKAAAEQAVLPGWDADWRVVYPVTLKLHGAQESAIIHPLDRIARVPGLPMLTYAAVADALLRVAANDALRQQRLLVTTAKGWVPSRTTARTSSYSARRQAVRS